MLDYNVMDCSDLSLDWKPLADLPDAEGFAGSYAGVSNGALIVAGGANFPEKPLWEGGPKRWTDRVFVMPPHGEGWQDGTPLPKPLGYGATASLPQGMMLIGGSNAGGALADCYMLTWEDGMVKCRELPSLPVTLTGHAAAVMGGKVYVQGGSIAPGEQDAESRLWIYDPAADTWTEGPSMPARGRFLQQMATIGHTIYVLGGIGLQGLAIHAGQGDGILHGHFVFFQHQQIRRKEAEIDQIGQLMPLGNEHFHAETVEGVLPADLAAGQMDDLRNGFHTHSSFPYAFFTKRNIFQDTGFSTALTQPPSQAVSATALGTMVSG